MIENEIKNHYHLVLSNGDDIIAERVFPGDIYSPEVCFSLDVREYLPEFLRILKQTLSDKNPTTEGYGYKFIKNTKTTKHFGPDPKLEKPKGNNNIFTLTIYMNKGVVVAKDFFVNRYNPRTRYSLELTDAIEEIVYKIEYHQKMQDMKYQYKERDLYWEMVDRDIHLNLGLPFSKITTLTRQEKKEMFDQIKNTPSVTS